MTEPNLFQEVKEDLERQRLEALWKKYGFWVIVAAVGIVVSTASSTVYRSWKSDREIRLTEAHLAAAKPSVAPMESIRSFEAFAAQNPASGQGILALLRAGALAIERDDRAKAIELFDAVAANAKADPALRQLGTLFSVQAQLDEADPAQLSARLQPLTGAGSAWSFSAREALGYLALRAGEKDKAKEIFSALSQDALAPQSLSARATDILRILN